MADMPGDAPSGWRGQLFLKKLYKASKNNNPYSPVVERSRIADFGSARKKKACAEQIR